MDNNDNIFNIIIDYVVVISLAASEYTRLAMCKLQRESFPAAYTETGFPNGLLDYAINGSLEIVHFKAFACIAVFQFVVLLIFIIPAMKSMVQIIILYIFVSIFGAFLVLGVGGEFFFLTLLLVTVGAIAVLYLFIVMVINLRTAYYDQTVTKAKVVLTLIYFSLVCVLLLMLQGTFRLEYFTQNLSYFVTCVHNAYFLGLDVSIANVNTKYIIIPLMEQGMTTSDVLDSVDLRRRLLRENMVEIYKTLGILLDDICPLAVEAVLEPYRTPVTDFLNPIYDGTSAWVKAASQGSMLDIHGIGNLLFGHPVYSPLVVTAGFILIFSLIGSVALTMDERHFEKARIMGIQKARAAKEQIKTFRQKNGS